MNSSELARLAGVTVRTLRHYHHVGVLTEPPRSANGYRRYDVHDLVRILRIKRLTAVGLALEQVRTLLDQPDDSAADLLDDLDAGLEARIEHLQGQRDLIAQLRARRTPPDVPLDFAAAHQQLARLTGSTEFSRIDREQAVLLAHLVGDTGARTLTELYEQLSQPATLHPLAALVTRFERLAPDEEHSELQALAADIVHTVAPALEAAPLGGIPASAQQLAAAHWHDLLNPAQRTTLAIVSVELSRP